MANNKPIGTLATSFADAFTRAFQAAEAQEETRRANDNNIRMQLVLGGYDPESAIKATPYADINVDGLHTSIKDVVNIVRTSADIGPDVEMTSAQFKNAAGKAVMDGTLNRKQFELAINIASIMTKEPLVTQDIIDRYGLSADFLNTPFKDAIPYIKESPVHKMQMSIAEQKGKEAVEYEGISDVDKALAKRFKNKLSIAPEEREKLNIAKERNAIARESLNKIRLSEGSEYMAKGELANLYKIIDSYEASVISMTPALIKSVMPNPEFEQQRLRAAKAAKELTAITGSEHSLTGFEYYTIEDKVVPFSVHSTFKFNSNSGTIDEHRSAQSVDYKHKFSEIKSTPMEQLNLKAFTTGTKRSYSGLPKNNPYLGTKDNTFNLKPQSIPISSTPSGNADISAVVDAAYKQTGGDITKALKQFDTLPTEYTKAYRKQFVDGFSKRSGRPTKVVK